MPVCGLCLCLCSECTPWGRCGCASGGCRLAAHMSVCLRLLLKKGTQTYAVCVCVCVCVCACVHLYVCVGVVHCAYACARMCRWWGLRKKLVPPDLVAGQRFGMPSGTPPLFLTKASNVYTHTSTNRLHSQLMRPLAYMVAPTAHTLRMQLHTQTQTQTQT